MSGGPAPDWEAIARHLAGEGDAASRARMEAFLQASDGDRELVKAVDEVSRRYRSEPLQGLDVEGALARVKARRGEAQVVPLHGTTRSSGRRPFLVWGGLAAAAAAAFLLWRAPAPDASGSAEVVYRGSVGRVDSVRLADGSLAMLAPGAQMTVPADFGSGTRTVRLDGRGWFRVEHAEGASFTVLSGSAVVRDIGTEFEVRPGVNGAVRVSVHEGTVAVRGTDEVAEVTLSKGDEVVVAEAKAAEPSRGTVDAADADWVSGRLHFRDVTVGEFVEAVSAWSGLVVRLDDGGLRDMRVTQDMALGEVRQRLEETALILGARVQWVGDTAVVSRGGGR